MRIFFFLGVCGVVKVQKQANKRKEKVNRNAKLKVFFFGDKLTRLLIFNLSLEVKVLLISFHFSRQVN